MSNLIDLSGRPFHFLGIGGIGMSALAYILAKRNLPVYGSDIRPNHITEKLQEIGAHIFWSQDASNLDFFVSHSLGVDENLSPVAVNGDGKNGQKDSKDRRTKNCSRVLPQVICSTAIASDNPEYQAAIDLGCPIFHRSDLLAALIEASEGIAVAGTHGKTTTSSALGHVLFAAGLDPTIVVGGEVNTWGGNAHAGTGKFLVAEADESDGSLVKIAAKLGVITNIELDHPDHYQSLEETIEVFQVFRDRCTELVGCIDCAIVREKIKPSISYSLNPELNPDYTVDSVVYSSNGTTAQVWESGKVLGKMFVPLLGEHNLSNALAVVAVSRQIGLDFEAIAQAIASFGGARRRFEHRGEYNNILFVDDYAHHPSEISATLKGARLHASASSRSHRIVAIFQPHRYSRTQAFLSEFAECLQAADVVAITDIYAAGEKNLTGLNSSQVAEIVKQSHNNVHYQPDLQSLSKFLQKILVPGDLALFLGAGNLNQIIPEVMAYYQKIELCSPAGSRS
jgi:UDP-N-acetylmuramate--alanine ligase